jgi:cell wall-associated NlpC family hydrolase
VTLEDLKYDHLVDLPFIWGAQDCLSLFRRFYADNFGISIRNYARPIDWSSDRLDLMGLCYEREGFEKITEWKAKDVRPGDVLCMSIGESNPNHFAIAVGNDWLVHHLSGRMSSKEVFRDFWRNHTSYILRHPDVPDLRPVYPDVDLMDLLNARKSAPTE